MATKRIKNDTGSLKTYVGQEISAGQYYTINIIEEYRWMEEAATTGTQLRVDIDSGDAKVNDGISDFTVTSEGLNFLLSIDAGCIKEIVVDSTNRSRDKKYIKYNEPTNKMIYTDVINEIALDDEGNILYDYDFNVISHLKRFVETKK